jgi:hypothetical protein
MMVVAGGVRAAQITPTLKSGYFVTSLGINFNGNNSSTAAGTFNIGMTGGPVGFPTSFEGYCVDLAHSLTGLAYNVNLLPETSLPNGSQVAWLYHHYGTNDFGTKVSGSSDAAALQAAIWDAEYDSGDGFASGNFRLQGLSGTVYTQGNAYLAASAGKSDTATYLQSVSHLNGKDQDMIGPSTPGASVPEPGSIAFMGSGAAGLVAFLIRRRKR